MKITLLTVEVKGEEWLSLARKKFVKKINPIFPVNIKEVSAGKIPRSEKSRKTSVEESALLKEIKSNHFVVLCDETGVSYESKNFSKKLLSWMGEGSSEIVFVIGGAYGVGDNIKNRANTKWSLSKMVLSHHIAQVVALEQIYRALSIWKGLPYHNE